MARLALSSTYSHHVVKLLQVEAVLTCGRCHLFHYPLLLNIDHRADTPREREATHLGLIAFARESLSGFETRS